MTTNREKAPHDCEKELQDQEWAVPKLRSSQASEGDLWTCVCGRKYEHYCSEAEGCGWQEIKPGE